jgi:alpha-ketoglutaric semialdehyde dehydrogenase
MRPLLVLIDLQNDYLALPHLEPAAGAVVHEAGNLLRYCRAARLPVAHVWTTVARNPDNRMAHWKAANLWQCEEGTPGHAPAALLAPIDGEPIIHKTGFSAFALPPFTATLREREIDTLILAGVKTHACVRQLALEAMQAGLSVWVASDAIASDDPVHAAITSRYLEARGVTFQHVAQLVAKLASAGQPTERVDDATKRRAQPSSDSGAFATGAARAFAGSWRETSTISRSELLRRLARLLAAKTDSLAALMAREIGKPIRFGRVEVERSVEMLEHVARRGDIGSTETCTDYVIRRPHGVVAVITPWNNPIYIPLGKIAPAILYGNAVVWKPAPEATAVSRVLFQCFAEAGWPRTLVSLVEGGHQVAEAVLEAEEIKAVTFTGSSLSGFGVQEICARRRIPLQAELGGNNAAIVWPDADLREAARLVAGGAFAMAGQRCTANRRVIVHTACHDAFLQRLLDESARLKWGDPFAPETDIGPMVSASHRDRVAGAVERATSQCGSPLLPLGTSKPEVQEFVGQFYPPTVICCDDRNAEIVQEETFGPVLVVQTATGFDDAMRACNGVRQGLVASIFTGSREIARRFLAEAAAGILKINQSTADAVVDVPFGGWKASGIGIPEHGPFDLEFFTRPQTVYGAARVMKTAAEPAVDERGCMHRNV